MWSLNCEKNNRKISKFTQETKNKNQNQKQKTKRFTNEDITYRGVKFAWQYCSVASAALGLVGARR
jgi:hypothetical protein